ncbi:MAG: sigma 54-interacting transcriptional regulator [Pseudomonadota bacterium]
MNLRSSGHSGAGKPNSSALRYLKTLAEDTSATGAVLFVENQGAGPLWFSWGELEGLSSFASIDDAIARVESLVADVAQEGSAAIRYFSNDQEWSCIICLDASPGERGQNTNPERVERRASTRRIEPALAPRIWIALSFDSAEAHDALRRASQADPDSPRDADSWLAHSLLLLAGILWDSCKYGQLLQDPTSQLPGRSEFQSHLSDAFQRAERNGVALGLLLVNPDGFGAINERLGREQGDRAVAEIAQLLRSSLRKDEQIYRYGGAVFAVLMPESGTAAATTVAGKLRESLSGAYLDGAVRLTFSIGAAVFTSDVGDDSCLDELGLLRRADHALNLAKRAGGGNTVLWNPDTGEEPDPGIDRLSGIFTANAEKDYRNMLLLWDTVALLSGATERPRLIEDFLNRVSVALKPRRIALLEEDGAGSFKRSTEQPGAAGEKGERFFLGAPQQALLHRAVSTLDAASCDSEETGSSEGDEEAVACHAIPVSAGDRFLACIYLEGPANTFQLDSSDLVFMDALASQLGLALDRMALGARLQREADQRSRRLREEVQDLRQAFHSARLIYQSSQMHAVLDTLRAVAATDVTVLIDGESGTGKEMLARAVHELSERREKPLVIVDCGAIASNLIEAELFGYVKGAFTGAQGNSAGRIAQAEGGTLFLDEIGEVPLDVQAKLLRFVQEKTISQVGSTTSRTVNTRIVAATNRDLGREAAAGRFREDLYYRLKVVTVTAPTLRERPDDILPLALHFLDKFALQYEKPVRRFEPEAEVYLQQYQWPGNVRELQNCILRAVVLAGGESIPRSALRVEDEKAVALHAPAPTIAGAGPRFATADEDDEAITGDSWLLLREQLGRQVDAVLADPGPPVPLGRWLTEDLLREAETQTQGNARRAAATLAIPETTFRRQLEKIHRSDAQGLLRRSPAWAGTAEILAALVRTAQGKTGTNIVERAKTLLLDLVVEGSGGKDSLGAQIMGVTVPTYRRWRADLPALGADGSEARQAG